MTFTIPDGYLNGPRAARAAHDTCSAMGERCPESLRVGIDGDIRVWIIKIFAPWIVAEFANERIPSFGIRASDGELTALDAGLWRKPLFIAAEAGYGGNTAATKDPGLAFVGGKTFDLRSPRDSVLPVVAAQDLMTALGAEHLPPRPTIHPEGAPDAFPPPNARAEAARWWMQGFAEGVDSPSRMKRDWVVDRCRKATGCTVDEARRAYSDLPVNLRNPSPAERNAHRSPSKS